MRGLLRMLVFSGLLLSYGCAENEPPAQKQGVEIHAPGVDIKINKKDGVNVIAPGTEVHTSKEKGVEVRAPGVEVDAQPIKPRPDSDPE